MVFWPKFQRDAELYYIFCRKVKQVQSSHIHRYIKGIDTNTFDTLEGEKSDDEGREYTKKGKKNSVDRSFIQSKAGCLVRR